MAEDAGLDIDFDAELAGIQGSVAGVEAPPPAELEVAGTIVTSDRTIEFMGRKFRIADKVGLMPLLKFSAFADVAVQDPRALGALYAMLRDCIHPGNPGCGECEDCKNGSNQACPQYDPGDWRAFEDHAMETKAEADDLMDVVTKTIEIIGRPPYTAAVALLTWTARFSGRIDGTLIRSSGRGLEALTPRQACNVAYSMLAERCSSDEELEQLDISLGMVSNPEEEALQALKAHQEEAGMEFKDPDAPVAPFGRPDPEALWP